jgi:glycosyltransferase involved in cell wall biosynthesis
VVDDGSTDNTNLVVATYSDHVQYICQENQGASGARNTGIRYAHGDYAVFLDADDLLLPDKLRLQATFLDQNPNVDIVYSDGYVFRINGKGLQERQLFSACGKLIKSLGAPVESLRILVVQNAFPPIAAMVRLRCIREIGGFDDEKSLLTMEDWDLWYRLAMNHEFAYLDAVVALYRNLPTSKSKSRSRRKTAVPYLESKMERSPGFATLSTRARARVHFFWGVMDLENGEPQMAIARFRKAIQSDPRNFYASSAYLLTLLLGSRAAIFYKLKRRILGLRKLPGL